MNGLEERVETLRQAGRDDLASDLLRASYHSRTIDDVRFVADDRVEVVSGPFRGEHDVTVDAEGAVHIDSESQYRFEGEKIEADFPVRSLTDAEHEAIREVVRPDGDDAEDASDEEADDPSVTAESDDRRVLADGGHSESSSTGVREKVANVLAKVLP